MSSSQLAMKTALRLAVKLLVMVALFLGPYAQSAAADLMQETGAAGHQHTHHKTTSNHDHHGGSHVSNDAGEASLDSRDDIHAGSHGDFSNCCEFFCAAPALANAHAELPIRIPSAMIRSRADAGVPIGEWSTPHRPPQRLI